MVGVGHHCWLVTIVGRRQSETLVVGIGHSWWAKTATESGGKNLPTTEEVMGDSSMG
jgi:hypothetical protein